MGVRNWLKLGSVAVLYLGSVYGVPLHAESQELPFEVIRMEPQGVATAVAFDATVEAVHQATVSAQTSGRIDEVLFDVDDYVDKGSIILRFRGTEQQARLEAAESAILEARTRKEEAEREYNRIQEVYGKKLVAKAALDKAVAEFEAAKARLASAISRLDEAREQLDYTVVRAPYSGIVVQRHVEVGEVANVGQPLMTGLSLDQLRVVVDVPQYYLSRVRQAPQAYIVSSGRRFVITPDNMLIFPYAEPGSHTIRVRMTLPQEAAGFYPGMSVEAGFVLGHEDRLLVPESAVAFRSEVTAVYVVDNGGNISLRQVRLGRAYEQGIEVLSGLHQGEVVALDPVRAAIYLKEH